MSRVVRQFLTARILKFKIHVVNILYSIKLLPKHRIKLALVCFSIAAFPLFPSKNYSQTSQDIALVVKAKGSFLLLREKQVWVNTVPNNIIHENDTILTLKEGFVAFILIGTKELIAVRPYSNIKMSEAGKNNFNVRKATSITFPIFFWKFYNMMPQPLGSAVAGIKG